MNRLLVKSVIAALLISHFACSQESETQIPQAVLSAFQSEYSSTKKVKWDLEDSGYEAEFELKNEEMSVTYDKAGNMLEAEMEIEKEQLPQSAAEYISAQKWGKIKEVSKIVKADETILYEAELKKGDAYFDEKGNFIELDTDKD